LTPAFLQHQATQKKALNADFSTYEMRDFGAGSKKMNSTRVVHDVYKNSATKGVYLKLLSQIVAFYQPKKILELGTSLGVGTFALTTAGTEVTTMDACPNTQAMAQKYFPETKAKVHFVNAVFDEFIPQDSTVYDLIFVDGHHDGEALKHYLQLLEKNSHEETIFILDDIRWSKSMFCAWEEIKSQEKYHLTMDLFKFGVVMRRKHQDKQHFIVRLPHILKSL